MLLVMVAGAWYRYAISDQALQWLGWTMMASSVDVGFALIPPTVSGPARAFRAVLLCAACVGFVATAFFTWAQTRYYPVEFGYRQGESYDLAGTTMLAQVVERRHVAIHRGDIVSAPFAVGVQVTGPDWVWGELTMREDGSDGTERVLGLAGDRVTLHSGRLWVDGQRLPDSRGPLMRFGAAADQDVVVPAGDVCAWRFAYVRGDVGEGGVTSPALVCFPRSAIHARMIAILDPPARRQLLVQ
jgi:hypothetical protein